jgi:U3 small nucleolar RNA-associated protein 12
VWNVSSAQCIRTLESGYGCSLTLRCDHMCCLTLTVYLDRYGLCGVFVPGDRHVVVGTKSGHLEVWELGSATCIQNIEAHAGSIWSMDLRPDGRGLITGSADKEVKAWEFELVSLVPASAAASKDSKDAKDSKSQAPAVKQLQLVHTRTLKLTDEVLCVRHSPNGKFVAVGLLDCTVKVFYEDSLKFFLSMYGHKLPVL